MIALYLSKVLVAHLSGDETLLRRDVYRLIVIALS